MTPKSRPPQSAKASSGATAEPTTDQASAASARPGHLLVIAAIDIVAPIGFYYLLRGAGLSPLAALAASAVPPALAAAWQLARQRRLDPVATPVIVTIALSLLLAAWIRDPRLLLAREGLLTGLWGIAFVISVVFRRPAAFSIARPLMEGRRVFAAGSWDDLWDREPAFGRIWQVASLIWGAALLTDAVVRVLMAFLFPVDEVPWLGGLLWPATLVLTNLVTNLYYRRAGLFRLLGARWQERA